MLARKFMMQVELNLELLRFMFIGIRFNTQSLRMINDNHSEHYADVFLYTTEKQAAPPRRN